VTEVVRGGGIQPLVSRLVRGFAFFPAGSTWSEQVVVPAGSIVLRPKMLPDGSGANADQYGNALTALRAGTNSLPLDAGGRRGDR